MDYIVLDLEWNQGTLENTIPRMPFEIVEIGAVKLNDCFERTGTFQVLVNPRVYPELSGDIHKIVPLDMEDLRRKGVDFAEAAERFFAWCGRDYCFCIWGDRDLTELQKNLEYFQVPIPFRTPVFYCDIQKAFGIQYLEGKQRCALEEAVERLGIPLTETFHRALEDAEYTSAVIEAMDKDIIKENYSVDCYKNPQKREDELHLRYPSCFRYISREFVNKKRMMNDQEVSSYRCYQCGQFARRRIRWYAVNGRAYYSLSSCKKHGYTIGKIRVRKAAKGVYADKLLKPANEEEAEYVRLRREELRIRRREKKKEKRDKKGIARNP